MADQHTGSRGTGCHIDARAAVRRTVVGFPPVTLDSSRIDGQRPRHGTIRRAAFPMRELVHYEE